MRAAHDAVLIGAQTARTDNPSLLARTEPPPPRQPVRVVVTTRLEIPPDAKLFADIDQSLVIIFAAERTSPARHAILEAMGVRIEPAPRTDDGLDMPAVLSRLGALGIASVLAEGGGKIAASLIQADAVDRLEWFRAPLVLGAAGKPAVADIAYENLAAAPRWRRVALRELGPDIWESYERAR